MFYKKTKQTNKKENKTNKQNNGKNTIFVSFGFFFQVHLQISVET